jgi:hypothetical protein
MKLAIIGTSPIALEAALRFHQHDAAITWFNAEEVNLNWLYTSRSCGWQDCTSDLGWELLNFSGATLNKSDSFSWEKWRSHYYLPLIEYLRASQEIKNYQVLSVSKRYLAPREQIPGRSRFFDLFRIIYQLNPEEFINQQKESDPETYQRLSEEFIHSLQSSLEMYQDYDLVIDARFSLESSSLAVTGRVLGEGRVSAEHLSSGVEALKRAAEILPHPDTRELALVGTGSLAAEILLKLEAWLEEKRSRLFIASHEEDPLLEVLTKAHPETKDKLQQLLKKHEEEFAAEGEIFHQKLREWQELDDFVQAKIPRPSEPIPRLVFFSGHNVTAIDQLIDRRRVFLTLEKPAFREGKRHPENNHLDLKTIGVDEVLSANPLEDKRIIHFNSEELGYWRISPTPLNFNDSFQEDLHALSRVEENIFKLFSPADSHQL